MLMILVDQFHKPHGVSCSIRVTDLSRHVWTIYALKHASCWLSSLAFLCGFSDNSPNDRSPLELIITYPNLNRRPRRISKLWQTYMMILHVLILHAHVIQWCHCTEGYLLGYQASDVKRTPFGIVPIRSNWCKNNCRLYKFSKKSFLHFSQ